MPRVRAISLHQPWATWIALRHKIIETRMWSTSYRGPLLICAALHGSTRSGKARFVLARSAPWPSVWMEHPVGCAVALVNLVDVRPMTEADEEAAACQCDPGRFAWCLSKIVSIGEAQRFPVKGRQGLFWQDVPQALLDALECAPEAELDRGE